MTDSVTLQTITRTAEKQFSRLSTDDQKKVLKKLKSPVPREQCTLVQNLRRFRVFHFSASETLRISFLRFQQRNCIVDIGVHPDFDRFAKNFRGCASQPISTLKDSPIMKNQSTKVVTPALAIAETKILHDTSRGSSNSAYGDLMMDVLSQICQDVIQRQVSAQLSTLEDDICKHRGLIESLDLSVHRMRDTQEQHDQNLTNIGQSMEETAASVSTLKTEEPRERGRLKKKILGMFHALEQAQSESREELDGQIGDLQNVIAMRFDALNEEIINHDQVHSEAGRLVQRLSQENQQLEQKVERLESRNQSLQEKTTHCESLLAETQGQLGELEKSVAEITQIQQQSQTRVSKSLKTRLTEFFQKMMPTVNKSPLPVRLGEKAKPSQEHTFHGTPMGT